MKNLMNNVKSFLQDEEGVTAIEYGLIASLVAVAIVAGAGQLGLSLNTLFGKIAACIANPSAANC